MPMVTANQLTAACAVGGLVLGLVAAVFAAVQANQAVRSWRSQTRPYVIVDFEFRKLAVYIAIKNISSTPARDVVIAFDKPLQTSRSTTPDINEYSVFTEPIPLLAPKREIHILLDSAIALFGDKALPLEYRVKTSYSDAEGRRRYDDPETPIDLRPFSHAVMEPKGLPDVVKEIENVHKELHKVISSSGLRVLAVDDRRRNARAMRPYKIQAGREAFAEGGSKGFVKWMNNEILTTYGWRDRYSRT